MTFYKIRLNYMTFYKIRLNYDILYNKIKNSLLNKKKKNELLL